jgi:hypothetical protein
VAKPRKAKLKVFRTSVGFDDAYVAAPSRKAALEAWGAGTDLFAAGAAEPVTDPALMKSALERPGEVVRVSRGSAAEQIKALGRITKKKPGPRIPGSRSRGRKSGTTKAEKRRPKPSRAGVEKAEKAVARAKARLREAAAKVRAEEQALEDERRKYRAAMAEWAGLGPRLPG